MRKDLKDALVLNAAILLLIPRDIQTDFVESDEGLPKMTRLYLRTMLFSLNYNDQRGKKSIAVNIVPLTDQMIGKFGELVGKIKEIAADYTAKIKEKQQGPLFQNALDLVSRKCVVDIPYLCRKLRVGQSCSEAFLEMMEEMGIVEAAGNGKYRVVMPKKMIDELIIL